MDINRGELLKPPPPWIAILHQKFEKSDKTTQNVTKTGDNHKGQLYLGLGLQFKLF